jgi:hypothetical protein
MERIEELIAKLDSLSEQEVIELVGLILEAHEKADGEELTASVAARLGKLAGFATKINAHRQTRELAAHGEQAAEQVAVTASGRPGSGVAAVAAGRRAPVSQGAEAPTRAPARVSCSQLAARRTARSLCGTVTSWPRRCASTSRA